MVWNILKFFRDNPSKSITVNGRQVSRLCLTIFPSLGATEVNGHTTKEEAVSVLIVVSYEPVI